MNPSNGPEPIPFSTNGQHVEPEAAVHDELASAPQSAVPGESPTEEEETNPDEFALPSEENAEQSGEVPLICLLESLLFVADEPVEPARLAKAVRCSLAEVTAGLAQLRAEYESHNRGVRLQERNGKVQLVTNPAAAQAVEDFLSLDLTTKLSGPALETLAIVAYRQPVTRVQIEAVRGVDCSGMVRKLEQQGLVEEVGRMETPGRPILYGVTDLFLQHFGLTHLEELPALPELDADSLRAVMALAEE